PPGGVMHVGNALGVAFAGVSDGDERLDHAPMLKPLALRPQDLLGATAQLFTVAAPKRSPRRKICDFPRS
ncbi:MAG: hypothetical protein ACREDI_09625, partial [Roseiarcus sp.]